jgi:hypothetical protein
MVADFRRLRGYDPRPWLPTLTGQIVGDAAASDRFLFDFRRTIADLVAQAHYRTITEKAHDLGLITYSEALEDHRPQLGDDMAMRSYADVPVGAMWTFPPGGAPRPTLIADAKGAASVAHLYGRPIAAAESFTAFGAPYAFSPRDLKTTADMAMSLGINRFLIHTSPHQPLTGGEAPGMSLAPFLGQYFSRNETWAEDAKPWIDYLARSSFLLQQGKPHADILYFYGEEAPLTALYGDSGGPAGVPAGYDVDFANLQVLQSRVSMIKGALSTADGVRYAVIALGGSSSRMSLAAVTRLSELVHQGARIAGPRPVADPGNGDNPRRWSEEVNMLWGTKTSAVRGVGKGWVFADLATALHESGTAPDWSGETDGLGILHRQLVDGELYFISDRDNIARTRRLSFRVTGRVPELWHADTGQAEAVNYQLRGDRTDVYVPLDAGEAVFVRFGQATAVPSRSDFRPTPSTLATLADHWSLTFAGRGAPTGSIETKYGSWTSSSDARVRYFSGSGTYTQTVNAPASWFAPGRHIWVDLGDVRDLANLSIDGTPVGTAWKPPFRIDVTDALHPGKNIFAIKVTNLWVNRLIGDAQPGAKPVTITSGATYLPSAPLRPSGLLGPVSLISTF